MKVTCLAIVLSGCHAADNLWVLRNSNLPTGESWGVGLSKLPAQPQNLSENRSTGWACGSSPSTNITIAASNQAPKAGVPRVSCVGLPGTSRGLYAFQFKQVKTGMVMEFCCNKLKRFEGTDGSVVHVEPGKIGTKGEISTIDGKNYRIKILKGQNVNVVKGEFRDRTLINVSTEDVVPYGNTPDFDTLPFHFDELKYIHEQLKIYLPNYKMSEACTYFKNKLLGKIVAKAKGIFGVPRTSKLLPSNYEFVIQQRTSRFATWLQMIINDLNINLDFTASVVPIDLFSNNVEAFLRWIFCSFDNCNYTTLAGGAGKEGSTVIFVKIFDGVAKGTKAKVMKIFSENYSVNLEKENTHVQAPLHVIELMPLAKQWMADAKNNSSSSRDSDSGQSQDLIQQFSSPRTQHPVVRPYEE